MIEIKSGSDFPVEVLRTTPLGAKLLRVRVSRKLRPEGWFEPRFFEGDRGLEILHGLPPVNLDSPAPGRATFWGEAAELLQSYARSLKISASKGDT